MDTISIVHRAMGFLLGATAAAAAAPPAMVRVPAGEFVMGDWRNEGQLDERPAHAVYLDGFLIDTFEVTHAQYAEGLNWAFAHGAARVVKGYVEEYRFDASVPFCDTTDSSPYSRIAWDGAVFAVVAGAENFPMVQVSWHGAEAYCNWRGALEGREYYPTPIPPPPGDEYVARRGYRLPTEAEWEKAAGWDPVAGRAFRFGEHTDGCGTNCLSGARANFGGSGDPFETGPFPPLSPVGFYNGGSDGGFVTQDARSFYGAYDLSGNVWEWCYDAYSSTFYASAPNANPVYVQFISDRVLRGGSWFNDPIACRSTMRNHHNQYDMNPNDGFRCALPITADLNGDGAIDGGDMAPLDACLSGPGNLEIPGGCSVYAHAIADWDGDQDVDLRDAALWMVQASAEE